MEFWGFGCWVSVLGGLLKGFGILDLEVRVLGYRERGEDCRDRHGHVRALRDQLHLSRVCVSPTHNHPATLLKIKTDPRQCVCSKNMPGVVVSHMRKLIQPPNQSKSVRAQRRAQSHPKLFAVGVCGISY